MVKINKFLILIQLILLNIIGQNITQCATTIQAAIKTRLDLKLLVAAADGNREIAKSLIEQGANVSANIHGVTPLLAATSEEQTEMVELLIKARADVNAIDNSGKTALIRASINGHKEIVKLLLLAGADTELRLENDKKAVECAGDLVPERREEIVKMIETEPTRREDVIKKWINDSDLARTITESTAGQLISDIAQIIAQYSIEYVDLPLEHRI